MASIQGIAPKSYSFIFAKQNVCNTCFAKNSKRINKVLIDKNKDVKAEICEDCLEICVDLVDLPLRKEETIQQRLDSVREIVAIYYEKNSKK